MNVYTNSQIASIIDEHIHDKRARIVLKLRFCDRCTYQEIAEHPDVNRSVRQVGYILAKYTPIVAEYLL